MIIEVIRVCRVCYSYCSVKVEQTSYDKWKLELEDIDKVMPCLSQEDKDILINCKCSKCRNKKEVIKKQIRNISCVYYNLN
jgi:hypothetical protein